MSYSDAAMTDLIELPEWPDSSRGIGYEDYGSYHWECMYKAASARLALAVRALEMIDETAAAKRKGAIIVAQGIAREAAKSFREPS